MNISSDSSDGVEVLEVASSGSSSAGIFGVSSAYLEERGSSSEDEPAAELPVYCSKCDLALCLPGLALCERCHLSEARQLFQ